MPARCIPTVDTDNDSKTSRHFTDNTLSMALVTAWVKLIVTS